MTRYGTIHMFCGRMKTKKRVGGRGCPTCGSHDTEGPGRGALSWCNTCTHSWVPCTPGCRGYFVVVEDHTTPEILGCPRCGVPNDIARRWPEAWRQVAARLDSKKLEAVVED